jgi:hypothetical protein
MTPVVSHRSAFIRDSLFQIREPLRGAERDRKVAGGWVASLAKTSLAKADDSGSHGKFATRRRVRNGHL